MTQFTGQVIGQYKIIYEGQYLAFYQNDENQQDKAENKDTKGKKTENDDGLDAMSQEEDNKTETSEQKQSCSAEQQVKIEAASQRVWTRKIQMYTWNEKSDVLKTVELRWVRLHST